MRKLNVGYFMHRPVGARENFEINENVEFAQADGLKLSKNITAKVCFLKLPHEINVQVKDLTAAASAKCVRCLAVFDLEVKVPFAEREFIIDLPERDLGIGEDARPVDKTTNEIELDGMFREEVLLHFPCIPVCCDTCKGLCDKCGANLNKTTCSCAHDFEANLTPFKFLRA